MPAAPALVAAALPRRVRDALEALHVLAFELVVAPFERALPELELRLTHLQDRGARHVVAVSSMDQRELLQRRRVTFVSELMQRIDEELAGLRDPSRSYRRAEPARRSMPSFEEMRLVEEDEADENAELRAIALRQESRAALPLQLLCQRFAVLGARPAFEPGDVPLGPRRLCELVLAAGEATGFSLNLRVALLAEFDRVVLADYPSIAEAVNDALARQRIMPGLSFVPLRPRPRTLPGEPDATPERERPHTGWTSQPASESDTTTLQLLQELLASRRAAAERFRMPGDALDRSRAELPTSDVLGMLDVAESVHGEDFESIRRRLLLRARQQHGQAVALSPHDADTFELLGLMYSHLSRELRTETAAGGMLEELKLPLLKVALTDPGFFVRSAHPARELLNAVAEAGARWQDSDAVDPQLLAHLQRAVAGIARPRIDAGSAFRDAVQSLEPQLQSLARRSEISERRHVEAARGKEKLAIARQRSTAAIEEALGDARLPLFHRNMLRHAWADVLTLGHLRHGDGSPDWAGLVEATRELVRAGSGVEPAPVGLQAQVDEWLTNVGYHAEDATRISRILTATEEEATDASASRTELAIRLKSRVRLGEETVPDESRLPPRSPAEQAEFERLRNVPFGSWIEFDEGDGPVRRRLSWLSPVTGTVLFVNQRGQRIGESTIDTLARQFAAGQARVVTTADGRLVDRAWRAALQSLRQLVRPGEPGGRERPA